ncbi:hypothetical protein QQP08_013017 [Theobroma cacao]|nr:hypothetical protein QQP08_013017 [Theobroma cacao]
MEHRQMGQEVGNRGPMGEDSTHQQKADETSIKALNEHWNHHNYCCLKVEFKNTRIIHLSGLPWKLRLRLDSEAERERLPYLKILSIVQASLGVTKETKI